MAEKGVQLYEGKAKKIFEVVGNPNQVIQSYKDDATAFNAQKRGTIVGKSVVNAKMTAMIFKMLAAEGIKNKTAARTNLFQTQLAKEKANEDAYRTALTGAYGAKYGAGNDLYSQLLGISSADQNQNKNLLAGRDEQLANLINARDLARITGQNAGYNSGAQLNEAGKKPSVLDDILRNIKIGVNFGK